MVILLCRPCRLPGYLTNNTGTTFSIPACTLVSLLLALDVIGREGRGKEVSTVDYRASLAVSLSNPQV